MDEIVVRFQNKSKNSAPEYATEGSSGMDLRANLDSPETLMPLQRKMIPTGIFLEIPQGYEAQVRPRSGMAWKHGITCVNSPGTVDSDYRGELKVILVNLSDQPHTIENGDRIAQIVFSKITTATLQPSDELQQSTRGEGGFGHTGHK